MIKSFNEKLNSDYFSEVYDYPGQWDVPSRCGLKMVKQTNRTVVIATELYAENPGTSVTNFCAQLATRICYDFKIEPNSLVFIVHDPDSRSKLSFLNEFFYRVDFDRDGERFVNPRWTQLGREEVNRLIGN